MPHSQQKDKNLDALSASIQGTYLSLREFEGRSSFMLGLFWLWNLANLSLLVFDTRLRQSIFFVAYVNVTVFLSAAYYREHGRNKVTSRFLSLLNSALRGCFLEVRAKGGRVDLLSTQPSSVKR